MESSIKEKIVLTGPDWVLIVLNWALLGMMWLFCIKGFMKLPDQIPTHFGISGEVDGYGTKSTVFLLPALGTLLSSVFMMLMQFPGSFNFPVAVTDTNRDKLYRLGKQSLIWLQLGITLLFSFLVMGIFGTATHCMKGLPAWGTPVAVAVLLAPLLYFAVKMFRVNKVG